MKKFILSMWICGVLLFVPACTPQEFFDTADPIVNDVNSVATEAQRVISSPAGSLIPEPLRTGIAGAIFIIGTLAGAYTEHRRKTKPILEVTKSIVNGIQNSSNSNEVKGLIKTEMINNNVLQQGNELVGKLKRSI